MLNLGFGKLKIMTSNGGNGVPIFLIHGNHVCQSTCHKLILKLIKKYFIAAVDMKGYWEGIGQKSGGKNISLFF